MGWLAMTTPKPSCTRLMNTMTSYMCSYRRKAIPEQAAMNTKASRKVRRAVMAFTSFLHR